MRPTYIELFLNILRPFFGAAGWLAAGESVNILLDFFPGQRNPNLPFRLAINATVLLPTFRHAPQPLRLQPVIAAVIFAIVVLGARFLFGARRRLDGLLPRPQLPRLGLPILLLHRRRKGVVLRGSGWRLLLLGVGSVLGVRFWVWLAATVLISGVAAAEAVVVGGGARGGGGVLVDPFEVGREKLCNGCDFTGGAAIRITA